MQTVATEQQEDQGFIKVVSRQTKKTLQKTEKRKKRRSRPANPTAPPAVAEPAESPESDNDDVVTLKNEEEGDSSRKSTRSNSTIPAKIVQIATRSEVIQPSSSSSSVQLDTEAFPSLTSAAPKAVNSVWAKGASVLKIEPEAIHEHVIIPEKPKTGQKQQRNTAPSKQFGGRRSRSSVPMQKSSSADESTSHQGSSNHGGSSTMRRSRGRGGFRASVSRNNGALFQSPQQFPVHTFGRTVSQQLPLNGTQQTSFFAPPTNYYPSIPVQMDMEALKYSLRYQVEFYFSVENLCKDIYIRQQMSPEGFVSLHLIASFNRVRYMIESGQAVTGEVDPVELLKESVQGSQSLELVDDCVRLRMGWEYWIINEQAASIADNDIETLAAQSRELSVDDKQPEDQQPFRSEPLPSEGRN